MKLAPGILLFRKDLSMLAGDSRLYFDLDG